MEPEEFSEYVKSAKILSIEADDTASTGFTIKFENEELIEIGVTTEWECGILTFENNADRKKREIEYAERQIEKTNSIESKNKLFKDIQKKYPNENWEEIIKTLQF